MTTETRYLGQVIAAYSNRYDVLLDDEAPLYQCQVRGNLKKSGVDVRVGDRVWVDDRDTANQLGRIAGVVPRHNVLSRPKIANVDQVVIVHPVAQPIFDPQQLDRYLVHAGLHQLPAVICLTKVDLLPDPRQLEYWLALYRDELGYTVLPTSIHNGASLKSIIDTCHGKISVLAGLSGAGKSTLLNQLNPQLNLLTGQVSDKLERGQHTTRHTQLLQPVQNVWIADTPGFSHLQFNHVSPAEIEQTYPEFRNAGCGFPNCLHRGEEHCNVTTLDTVDAQRLAHYHLFIQESEEASADREEVSQKREKGSKQMAGKGGKAQSRVRLGTKQREASRRQQRQALTEHTYIDVDAFDDGDAL